MTNKTENDKLYWRIDELCDIHDEYAEQLMVVEKNIYDLERFCRRTIVEDVACHEEARKTVERALDMIHEEIGELNIKKLHLLAMMKEYKRQSDRLAAKLKDEEEVA